MSIGETTSLTVLLKGDIVRLEASLRRAEGRLAKTNSYMKNSSSQIAGYLGSMFAIGAVVQFGRAQTELITKIDANNRALKAITETSEEYSRVKAMLNDSAEKFGINILDLTKAYGRFYAASKNSTLTTTQLDTIFNKVTKSAAVLGLSADETTGVLKALEQMLSKGKVQAEELRGQLGDRLPGAFNIMADSMGVTTAELDKMLKMGGVMADEVLPKFADQMEIAYGSDQVDRIETLRGSFNRLDTAWIDFIESVDNGEGVLTRVLKGTSEGIAKILKYFAKGEYWEDFTKKGRDAFDVSQKLFKNLADPRLDAKKWTKVYIADLDEAFSDMASSSGDMTETMRADFEVLQEKLAKYGETLIQIQDPTSRQRQEIINLGEAMNSLNDVLGRQTTAEREASEARKEQTKVLEDKADAIEEVTKAIEKQIKVEEKSGLYKYLEQEFANSEFKQKNQEIDAELNIIFGGSSVGFDEVAEEYKGTVDGIVATVDDANEKLSESTMAFRSAVIHVGTDIIAGFAEALATGGIQDYFDSLMAIIGKGMSELGRSLIAIGIAEKVAAMSFNPAAKIAAGAALVFLGAAFSKSSAKMASNIGGGAGYGGGGFQSTNTGQTVSIEGDFKVQGKDLVLALKNYTSQNSRSSI